MQRSFEGKKERIILLVCLLVALYACYQLLFPYLQPIVIAILLGMLVQPLHQRLVARLGNRPNIGAVISCSLLTLVLLIPAVLVILAIVQQGAVYAGDAKNWASHGGTEQLMQHPWVQQAKGVLTRVLPDSVMDPENIRKQLLGPVSSLGKGFVDVGTSLVGSFTQFLVQFTLMLFVLFFVLRDHEQLVSFLRNIVPLSRSQEDALLDDMVEVTKSAILGSFLTAISQGILGGIAVAIAGFPALFWGTMIAFASLIPVIGTALIWVPMAAYLALQGHTSMALFLVAWGVLVIGSADNFLRPLFMRGSSTMNAVVIFFSILGGLNVFGLMGLLYGPLIFSLTLVLLRLYEKEFADFLHYQDKH